jgi:beta-galactosidase
MRLKIRSLLIAFSLIWSISLYSQSAEIGRRIINFDEGWSFQGEISHWTWRYKWGSDHWEKVNLPHDWSIKGPFDKDEPSGEYGAYLPTGTGVYRKSFILDKSLKDKTVSIEFDGVYMNSEVYCNGIWLGKRPNGYMGFSYDLTPWVKFGDFENKISVLVDNSVQINCRWYTGSGITRHVRIIATDNLHIPQWGTFVSTPEIHEESALVNVKITIRNMYTVSKDAGVRTSIFDTGGNLLAEKTIPVKVDAKGEAIADVSLSVASPSLWSPRNPVLYQAKCEIILEDEVVDEYYTIFGIRKIRFDTDKGFFLNDENMKLKGVCLHHDGGAVGAAVPEQVWARRLRMLKDMGCNAIRTSHNPYSPEFYNMCDSMGFLVMDEFFDEWSIHTLPDVTMGYNLYWDEWWKRDLVDGIKRDRNHPSVFMYSAGNEIIEQNRPWGKALAEEVVALYHETDPTRLVTCGNNMVPEANMTGFADVFDVAGYNYGPMFEMYDVDRKAYPERKFIGTENTRGKSTRGVYVFPIPPAKRMATSKEGYSSSYNFLFRGFGMEHEWKETRDRDYVAGLFLWPGIDYLGETEWPMISVDNGAMDRCAFPKDSYYFYQSQWTDKPVLHIFPHWNWKGREGEKIPVWTYTNCDAVELFLNGRSLGKRDFNDTDKLHLEWNVSYQPGEIKAIGYKNGKQIMDTRLVTTEESIRFKIEADRSSMAANGTDVVHLRISAVDRNNIEVPTADEKFRITIEGPAKLLALDNGDPLFNGNFQSSEISLFNGLALAIIQSGKEKGKVKVIIEGENIKKTETITVLTE